MSDLGSDGHPKHDALVEAAKAYVDLALDGDYLQLVSFDDVAEAVPSAMVGTVSGSEPTLVDANSKPTFKSLIDTGFTPRGATSIGNGISVGNSRINMPAVVADQRAILVLTDGVENTSLYVADVVPTVNARAYAIGLGTAENTSAPVLQEFTGNRGGYLLITGVPTPEIGSCSTSSSRRSRRASTAPMWSSIRRASSRRSARSSSRSRSRTPTRDAR